MTGFRVGNRLVARRRELVSIAARPASVGRSAATGIGRPSGPALTAWAGPIRSKRPVPSGPPSSGC